MRLRCAPGSVLRRAPAVEIRPVLAPTLAVHRAERLNPRRLVARVRQQQRDDAVRGHARCGEVADRGAVVGVRPQILSGFAQGRSASGMMARCVWRQTYADSILPAGPDPGRLSEVEEHVRGLVQRVELPTPRGISSSLLEIPAVHSRA